jgi:hypothetical protein
MKCCCSGLVVHAAADGVALGAAATTNQVHKNTKLRLGNISDSIAPTRGFELYVQDIKGAKYNSRIDLWPLRQGLVTQVDKHGPLCLRNLRPTAWFQVSHDSPICLVLVSPTKI